MRKINTLEERMAEVEDSLYEAEKEINKLNQYSRRENIEIIGIPDRIKQEDLEEHVIKIINSLDIEITSYDIAACHRLKKKDTDESANTIVRFICRKKVSSILSQKKKLSEEQIINKLGKEYFITDNLSPMNRKCLNTLNYLKKKNIIKSCWSYNGIINYKLSDNKNERSKKLFHYDDILYYIPRAANFI